MKNCPVCGSRRRSPLITIKGMPVHSVLLLKTREEAVNIPKGDIFLSFCEDCHFIENDRFDPGLMRYFGDYEENQSHSDAFYRFQSFLASELIDRIGLRGKKILEIGCGKGDFLSLLCKLGNNWGVGYDPAYRESRGARPRCGRAAFIRDFYSGKSGTTNADLICCRMTLEHIPDPLSFLRMIRSNLTNSGACLFLQVPDSARIIRERAFWDIYYEHCNYFTSRSLRRVMVEAGFQPGEIWLGFEHQYLMATGERLGKEGVLPEDVYPGAELPVLDFEKECMTAAVRARERARAVREKGKRLVLWGGGSKAVAFLNILSLGAEVAFVVDINPFRQGTFIAGTGHAIVAPGALSKIRPDVVIVMNPIYIPEIRKSLMEIGISAILETPDSLGEMGEPQG